MQTILVVDDDDGVRRLIEHGLTEAGFNVIAAADTVVALHELEDHPQTDLCLIDLVMPTDVPNGRVFAQSVRNLRPDMPIILMTGYYGAASRVRNYATLMYKPIDLDVLVAEIKRQLPSLN